ncbi:MAG: serine/threonine-protein phosphatase [Oscillospiraceae bacterium]|nr:serine/threonine-protein phosphatase [Oscillospiraceae bacterium]
MKKKTVWLKIRFRWLGAAAALLALSIACMVLRDLRSEPLWSCAEFFLTLAALMALLTTLRRLYAGLYHPLDYLQEAVDAWQEDSGMESLLLEEENQSDEVRAVARSVYTQLARTSQKVYQIRTDVRRQTEQTVRRELAEEIGRNALPQVLPDYPSRENFYTCGLLSPGNDASCCFYDYFYIDPGLLCVSIGQVPGGGVSEALYMVVAQTTVRSRLRQGRSLAETMADVNAQLYDLGSRQSFNVLVGTLNTSDGRFHYINAGQALPLLMRNESRCEWLEAPVYAPLGINESVTYQTMDLRLKQGDRLLFHTSGLGRTEDGQGKAFGEQELRSVLNLSVHKELEPEGMLSFLQAEAAAFCVREQDRLGYAALLLEFRKGDKELAHCEVPSQPAYAREVAAFLKKQFTDNGISPRSCARAALIVDELFALCCRRAGGGMVMVECGIAPDAQMVNIRMTAPLGGVSPLENNSDCPSAEAAEFVCSQADYVTFKTCENDSGRDTLTVVCFLE